MTEAVKKVWVELLDDNHTHKGKACKKGDKIQLRQDQADRLIGTASAKQTQAPDPE